MSDKNKVKDYLVGYEESEDLSENDDFIEVLKIAVTSPSTKEHLMEKLSKRLQIQIVEAYTQQDLVDINPDIIVSGNDTVIEDGQAFCLSGHINSFADWVGVVYGVDIREFAYDYMDALMSARSLQ